MENKITGKVLHISGIETVGQNATEKQTIVVEETGQEYPQSVAIDALKDKVQQLAGISEGDEVTAHFNLKAREYNGRWFQNVNLWKVEKASGQKQAPLPQPTNNMVDDMQEDDLPF